MASRHEIREYESHDGRRRMQVYETGFEVRFKIADERVYPTMFGWAESFEEAVRFAMRTYGTAWHRVEVTRIGW